MANPSVISYALDTAINPSEAKYYGDDREITVPASTTTTASFGLIPVKAGMKLKSFTLWSADLDTATAVTLNLGIRYRTGSSSSDALAAFVSASTIAQTGGAISNDDNVAAVPTMGAGGYTFLDDGWISLGIQAGTTTTAGVVRLKAELSVPNH
jgi:hypothetical protein